MAIISIHTKNDNTIKAIKALLLLDPTAKVNFKKDNELDEILAKHQNNQNYDEIRANMERDINAYKKGDLSNFEKFGEGWYENNSI